MSRRMKIWGLIPEFRRAQLRLTQAAKKGLGDPVLVELVVLRASQVNRCASCIDMHVRNLREAGVSPRRIDLLPAWEEAGDLYSERERAALALTEAVTVLTEGQVPDAVYERAADRFTEVELAHLIGVIVAINNWNRVNVTVRKPPGEEL
ncbi:carboxymuconolactone decarboxylase family protein [Streptomyces sp. CT34]|uniref:carboxymuconolactone decarboxylase family protein n=1 Tax=Streptomyces sp. CT34 TaxID=1553907 RepID=UPI0005BC3125|nr:carboxymuconolactone decarboxylase family protein [Streptomyces sp. CT34]